MIVILQRVCQNATEIVPNTSNDNHFIDKSGINRTSGEWTSLQQFMQKQVDMIICILVISASRLYGVFDISNGAVMLTNSNGTDCLIMIQEVLNQ